MKTLQLNERWQKILVSFVETTAKTAKKILLLEIEGDQKQSKELVEPGIPMKGVRLWFLLAIIDDYSRVIVGHRWSFEETTCYLKTYSFPKFSIV